MEQGKKLGAAAPGGERGPSGGCGCVLKPEALQLALAEALSQNVFSSMLLSTSGELISCAGERAGEDLVSAIVASVWKTYQKGDTSDSLHTVFINCDEGVIAFSQVVSNALVCIVAESTAPLGLLKLKLNALRAHLSGALAPIFNAA